MEWEKPAANCQSPTTVKRLYNLPDFANDFLRVPLVDTPVLPLQSSDQLSEDGQGSIRDSWDKKIEIVLRHNHEATALAIKARATASVVTRASIVWGRKMLELLPDSETRLIDGASRMLKASSFVAEATLDGMIFASKAMASSVVARRGIWLRTWQAEMHSKQLVASYPFKGEKLFGPSLDKILVKTKVKKKALPKSLRKTEQRAQPFCYSSFRPNHFQSRNRQEGRRTSWGSGNPQYRWPFPTNRSNRFPFLRGCKQERVAKTQKT